MLFPECMTVYGIKFGKVTACVYRHALEVYQAWSGVESGVLSWLAYGNRKFNAFDAVIFQKVLAMMHLS